MGRVASDNLQTGKGWFQRRDIIKLVGKEISDTGLIIGNKDFGIFGDETATVFILFPHKTIQEFLGSFYFIYFIDEKQSIQNFLNCEKPIFLENRLFHHFCLYFLSREQNFVQEKLDMAQIRLHDLVYLYPSFRYGAMSSIEKLFGFNILMDTLAICRDTTDLIVVNFLLWLVSTLYQT